MPKLGEFLFGKKAKTKKESTLTPAQEELMGLLGEGLKTGEGALGDIFGFKESQFQEGIEKPALKHFQESVLPSILEKFAGQGNMGSGIRRSTLKAGTDLQSNLAGLRYQAQQDAMRNKLTGLNQFLGTRAFENVHRPETEGLMQGVYKGFATGLGQGIGSMGVPSFGGFGGGGGATAPTPGYAQNATNAAQFAAVAG